MSDIVGIVVVQPVEYLGLSDSLAAKAQAKRLSDDLGSVLNRSVVLLAGIALASAIGCSARVEVESATRGSPIPASEVTQAATDERARTVVEIGLLQERTPEPAAALKPSEPPPPASGASEPRPVTILGNTFILNYRAGDVINHVETHVHLHEPSVPRIEERIVVHREVQAEPRRPVDERCEKLAREHEARVEMWKRFPFGR
jgi:hypothetical protein